MSVTVVAQVFMDLNTWSSADQQWADLQKGWLWGECLRDELIAQTLTNLARERDLDLWMTHASLNAAWEKRIAECEPKAAAASDGEDHLEDDGNTNPSLRIGNLSTASDRTKLLATLRAEFGAFGKVSDVNLPMDRTTGNIRGFAFIEFKEPRDASRAFRSLIGKLKLGGRDIRIEYAASTRKSTAEMAATYGADRF